MQNNTQTKKKNLQSKSLRLAIIYHIDIISTSSGRLLLNCCKFYEKENQNALFTIHKIASKPYRKTYTNRRGGGSRGEEIEKFLKH